MSNARRLNIEKIEPAKTFLFGSTKLETKASSIRNKAVDALNGNDISVVVYRYLQSRSKHEKLKKCAMMMSAMEVIDLLIFRSMIEYNPIHLVPNLIGLSLIYLCTSNASTHHKTADACEQWLAERMSPNRLDTIKKASFNSAGLSFISRSFAGTLVNMDYINEKQASMNMKGI
jgi:hypothetical protein